MRLGGLFGPLKGLIGGLRPFKRGLGGFVLEISYGKVTRFTDQGFGGGEKPQITMYSVQYYPAKGKNLEDPPKTSKNLNNQKQGKTMLKCLLRSKFNTRYFDTR